MLFENLRADINENAKWSTSATFKGKIMLFFITFGKMRYLWIIERMNIQIEDKYFITGLINFFIIPKQLFFDY